MDTCQRLLLRRYGVTIETVTESLKEISALHIAVILQFMHVREDTLVYKSIITVGSWQKSSKLSSDSSLGRKSCAVTGSLE